MSEEVTIFDRILRVDQNRRIAWGVVVESRDSDTEEEIEKAAHEFMIRGRRFPH